MLHNPKLKAAKSFLNIRFHVWKVLENEEQPTLRAHNFHWKKSVNYKLEIMVKTCIERVIDLPVDEAWNILADFSNVQNIHPLVETVDQVCSVTLFC